VKRLKPEQIQAGRSYRLSGGLPVKTIIRRVEGIRGNNVVVNVNGEMKEFPLKVFANLVVEEVQ
jgi:hypothetical protein